jgi:chromosome segregation ATPase
MSESHSASVNNSVREDAAPADPGFVAKLQKATNLANENCDRATKLAQKLSVELREAQFRINQLELEADRMSAKLQSDANARIERAKQEADARIARVEGEAESRIRHLQAELAQAQQLADRAKANAQIAQERIARAETEANERLRRAKAEIEDRFIRLKADLVQAELRADRAEQWLGLIRREIEGHLMPSLAPMHDQLNVTIGLSRPVPSTSGPSSSSLSAASDEASDNEPD